MPCLPVASAFAQPGLDFLSLFLECRLSFKSHNRDPLKLAHIEIITDDLKESTIMKNTVFRGKPCLDVTEKRDEKNYHMNYSRGKVVT